MECKINKNILISFILIVIIISFTGVASYAKFITSISKKGIIETAIAQYCEEGWNLKECLIRSDSHQELNVAKSVIASRSENVDFSQIAGKTKYTQIVYTRDQNTNYDEAYSDDLKKGHTNTTNSVYYGDGYTFDEDTGYYYGGTVLYGVPSKAITVDENNKIYVCIANVSYCASMYVIYSLSSVKDDTGTTTYYVRQFDRYSQQEGNVTSNNDSGMFLAEDDYTDVTNLENGVEFYFLVTI